MASQAAALEGEVAASDEKVAAPKRNRVRAIALGVLAVGIAGILGWYVLHAGLESTDDAQIDADVVSVPSQSANIVTKVLFVENQIVKAGDVLVELDSAQATARLAEAEAQVATAKAAADASDADVGIVQATVRGQKSAAEASLQGAAVSATATSDEIAQADAELAAAVAGVEQARSDLERQKRLFADNATPKQELDRAQTTFDAATARRAQAAAHQAIVHSRTAQARASVEEARARVGQTSAVAEEISQAQAKAAEAHARVQAAEAQRDLAAIEVAHTKVVAPRDGIASRKGVVVGQLLAVGQPVASIVPATDVWVTANFKETQLDKMRVGQPADIDIDAYSGLQLHGEVESLSGATGARFSLLPPENATGNFTKVVQRVPVKIRIKDLPTDRTLRPGMSADVTVDTRK
jgi:membrane fusion protein, multidrug efflux system